jgi:hypothetical protein
MMSSKNILAPRGILGTSEISIWRKHVFGSKLPCPSKICAIVINSVINGINIMNPYGPSKAEYNTQLPATIQRPKEEFVVTVRI